jgi:hypothetical protein
VEGIQRPAIVPKPGTTGVIAPGRPFPPQQQHQPIPQQQYQQQNMYGNNGRQQLGGPNHLHPPQHQQQQQPQQWQYGGPNDFQQRNNRDIAQLSGGFNGMSLHPQNQPQYQHHNSQQAIGHQLQQPSQFSGTTYTFSTPIFANGTNVGMTVQLSPPVSPLPAYLASPVMGTQTIYNPFVNGGFSPLLSTVGIQGPLASYLPAGVSPLISPGSAMLPRDVMFEENISNAHNLFTPATYTHQSPLLGARDLHYSPVMYQAGFTVSANAFAPQGGSGHGGGNGFDLHGASGGYGRKQQMQKVRKSPAGDASRAMPKAAVAVAAAAVAAEEASASPPAVSAAAPRPIDEALLESVDTPTAAAAVPVPAPEHATEPAPSAAPAPVPIVGDGGGSFFDAPPDSANCSPLEPEFDVQSSEQDSPTEDTTAESDAPLSAHLSAGQLGGTEAGGTPTKSQGPSRRNMIIKHTKQLVA